jgi:tetratricopeptide (TPR) repeat protein
MSKRSRRNRKEKPPPNGTNNTDNDEIEDKEQLARLKLHSKAARNEEERKEIELERKKVERHYKLYWYSKSLFTQASIGGLIMGVIAASVVWFYVSGRGNIKMSREIGEIEERIQDLIEERKELDEMILQHAELQNQKIRLEVDIETFMHEKDLLVEKNVKLEQEYKHKIKTLDGTYAKKMLALKEEYTKENKELKKSFEDISSFDNWFSRGVGEFIDGKNAEAIDSFNKALETNPDTKPAAFTHNYIGLSNERRDKTKEAIESYTKAIEIYKKYAVAYMNRGNAYFRLKEYKKAFKDANIAIAFFIIKGEYKAAKEHIEDKLQGLERVETDEKFDENMKKSAGNHIATLKKQLEEVQKRTTK